jgi:hypothetical protein
MDRYDEKKKPTMTVASEMPNPEPPYFSGMQTDVLIERYQQTTIISC